jgi:hypothetical protein
LASSLASIGFARGALGLERGEEAAGSAHRADDTVIGQQPLELLARVYAAAIGVMQQRLGAGAAKVPVGSLFSRGVVGWSISAAMTQIDCGLHLPVDRGRLALRRRSD